MKLKMPYGISNFEELITEDYYYVEKYWKKEQKQW